MHSVRPFLRTTIKKVISDWTGEKDPTEIARFVVDVVLLNHNFSHDEYFEGIYKITYEETCRELKGKGTADKPNATQLELDLKVPKAQAVIIAEIALDAVYVPSLRAYKDLYGKSRIRLSEIPESVEHYRSEAAANQRIADLLQKLVENPGNYYK